MSLVVISALAVLGQVESQGLFVFTDPQPAEQIDYFQKNASADPGESHGKDHTFHLVDKLAETSWLSSGGYTGVR